MLIQFLSLELTTPKILSSSSYFQTNWASALVKGIRDPHKVKKKSFDRRPRLPLSDLVAQSAEYDTVDPIRRLWVRFPPRSKNFFFTSVPDFLYPTS